MYKTLLAAGFGLLATACSTYQAVSPVERLEPADPIAARQPDYGAAWTSIPGNGAKSAGGVNGANGARNKSLGADGELFCVITNPVSGNEFVASFRESLLARGFDVKLLPPYASVASCPLTATYAAKSQWFWNTFIATADIAVFRNGDRVGKAVYSANRSAGGTNLSNLVPADSKIEELVEQLMPGLRLPPAATGTPAQAAMPASPAPM